MDNNLNENIMNNIKNMIDSGNISGAISQIPPEMIQNFSNMMKNSNHQNSNPKKAEDIHTSGVSSSSEQAPNFDFNNIDMETIIKISSAISQMNDKNDPRANLLYSLKPYLRDQKKNKLDQYANLLNISKIANIIKNDKKENT